MVRAEGQACRSTAETLCREMAGTRAELDAAVGGYERRKAELMARETVAHDKLARVLRGRSAAEFSLEKVRDHADNELKARRTATTVRAYRLDARWRQLHDRYRGFVVDVLDSGGDGGPSTGGHPRRPQLRQTSDVQRQHARFGRRFFGVADRVSTQYRRESLRTTRSLHALMHGYLKESSGGSTVPAVDGGGGGPQSNAGRRSLAALDGAGPTQVLDKLRVMQEQCARIAERVRRRSGSPGDIDGPSGGGSRTVDADRKSRLIDSLSEAHHRLATGREFVRRTRALMDRAVADVQREHSSLRGLLCAACATCVGREAQLNGSCTVVDVAARLERACFALFVRLDKMMQGSDAAAARRTSRGPPGTGATTERAHDVVTLCLRAVQAQRTDTVRQAQDIAYRVDNFHKAVNRLLLATTSTARRPPPARVLRPASNASRGPAAAVAPRPRAAARVRGKTFASFARMNPTLESTAAAAVAADTATVTMLCPPSIGIIEYE